jgi:NAD(P)-dependent dehydrogenase (short-subunit alcohol dehydrogenase family)
MRKTASVSMGPKKIVLTGCTRGLGRALVDAFIAGGHTVIGCGRSPEAILELRFGQPASSQFDVLDVAEPTRVALWAEKVMAVHGAPDLLINNAAMINTWAHLTAIKPEEISRLFDINVKGVVYVTQAFLPAMIAAGRGVVVNLSSGWGRTTAAHAAPYCASKWAVEGLTQSLAQEVPPPLAAVPLSPGVIDTDMLRQCGSADAASYPKPADWARVAVPYLLQLGRKDNGQSLTVPGFGDE